MSQQITPNRRVNTRAIIMRDGKLLTVRHKDRNGQPAPYSAVPGGGLDPHESLYDGARREVMEELGVEARIGKLLFIQQYFTKRSGFTEELELFFAIDNPEDFDGIDLKNTSHGDDEIAYFEYVDPKEALVYPKFLSEIDLDAYINGDLPVLIIDNFHENL